MSSPLWQIVQDWYDNQQVPPSWAKVAATLGVSQSTFDTWKAPSEMPRRRTLYAIHELTRVPFKTVVDAAIESVNLYDADRAKQASVAHRKGKSATRSQKQADLDEMTAPQEDGPEFGA